MSLPWLLAIACATAGCTQLLDIEDPPPGPDGSGEPRRVAGRVQERYGDVNTGTQLRPAPDAQVELVAGGSIVASTVTNAAGEYLVELPGGAPADVVIRARRAGDLEAAVFPADPIRADATIGFTMYTQPAIASLAASVTIQHDPADRYVLVRLSDLVGPVAGAVIGSSSGGVRYADADGVLTAQLTETTASGLAAIFGVKAPAITVSITTPAGTRQLDLDLGPALTAHLLADPS